MSMVILRRSSPAVKRRVALTIRGGRTHPRPELLGREVEGYEDENFQVIESSARGVRQVLYVSAGGC